jgi:hypothetical protein
MAFEANLAGVAMTMAIGLGIGAAQAQQATTAQTATCLVGGISFTTGATALAGERVTQCGADGTWIDFGGDAFGCIYASKTYAVGALLAIEGGDGQIMQCLKEGIWKKQD